MALHARSVALAAGATGAEVERIAAIIVEARDITVEAARRALGLMRQQSSKSSTSLPPSDSVESTTMD
jgi:hydroxymethylglutaryl-CoA reductase